MPAMTQAQYKALVHILDTLVETIREVPDGMPNGRLYAMLMSDMSHDTYEFLIGILVQSGKVTQEGFLLKAVDTAKVTLH